MTGKGNPRRGIRIEPSLWERFGAAARAVGRDRAGLIRDMVRCFVDRPADVMRLLGEHRQRHGDGDGDGDGE